MPWNPFREPLIKPFSRRPLVQMFYECFFLWARLNPVDMGHSLIYLGVKSAWTCPCTLLTAAREKSHYCSHPEVLAPNGLSVPARVIANMFLVRVRSMALFCDSALGSGCRSLTCTGLESPVLFLLARGCSVCETQTAAWWPCPGPGLLWSCRVGAGGQGRRNSCEGIFINNSNLCLSPGQPSMAEGEGPVWVHHGFPSPLGPQFPHL